jgi:hypothetical protein
MGTPPKGLVVTCDYERADTWRGWLRRAGYVTLGCVGPGLTLDCPRVRGARCVLREGVNVAIVDVGCDADAGLCTRLADDGSTVFVPRDGSSAVSRASVMERVSAASRSHRAVPATHRPWPGGGALGPGQGEPHGPTTHGQQP